jgi:hypothetical protein
MPLPCWDWFVEAQESLFQRWFVGRNIGGAVLARDLDDLLQVALNVQLQDVFIRSLRYSGHTGDRLEPFHRGRDRR